MAQYLEDSDYTSIQQGIRDTARRLGNGGDQLGPVAGVPGKCSLSVSIAQYLNLVDWTGRRMHPNKRGRINPERPPVPDRLGLTDRNWTTQVKATQSEFYRAIGAAVSLIEYAKQIGQHWMQSLPPARSGGIGVARVLCKMRPKPG